MTSAKDLLSRSKNSPFLVMDALSISIDYCLGNILVLMHRYSRSPSNKDALVDLRTFMRECPPFRPGWEEDTSFEVNRACISWKLSENMATAVKLCFDGYPFEASSLIEDELNEKFPGWSDDC